MTRFNLQIRGVLIELESELQALHPKSSNMTLDENEISFNDEEQFNTGLRYSVYEEEQVNIEFQYPVEAHKMSNRICFRRRRYDVCPKIPKWGVLLCTL